MRVIHVINWFLEPCGASGKEGRVARRRVSRRSTALSGLDDLEILGTDLNGGSFALIALSPNPAMTQAFGGTICLGQGLVRLGVLPTGGSLGTADGEVATGLTQAQLANYGPGSLLYAQLLVRDTGNPDGSGAALTAGIEFRVNP